MPGDGLKLLVHTRRTFQPDWTERESSYVRCPRTAGTKPVEACKECGQSTGIVRDADGHWFVVCTAVPEPAEAPARLELQPGWEQAPVADVMTADPICIHEDVRITEVVALLVEHGIGGAPVVDDEGRPLGMVSQTDLMMEEYERTEEEESGLGGHGRGLRASDIMTPRALTVPETGTLLDALRLMSAERVHRLAVVDSHGLVVGMLSTIDVIDAVASRVRSAQS